MAKKKPPRHLPTPHPSRDPRHLEVTAELIQTTSSYQAPLPPPQMLADYEQVLPGLADRIVSRMESQTEHRQQLESRVVGANIANERRAQIIAGILGLIAILASFYLIANDKDQYGIAIFITTFASFIAIFIVGKIQQNRQLAIRREAMKELLPKPPPEPHE